MAETTNRATARMATIQGALPLRKLTLIGIAGTPENRRALLRTPGGQIRQITHGDTLRQGTVVAISDSAVTLADDSGRTTVMTLGAAPRRSAA